MKSSSLMLAFDHRGHFERLVAGHRPPQMGTFGAIADAKTLIYRAAAQVRAQDPQGVNELGVFVDEQYGAALAAQARADRLSLVMPVEQSDQDQLRFEFGERQPERIALFKPDLVKVLVRYDAAGDAELAAWQCSHVAKLSRWCAELGQALLVELLVPGRDQPDHFARTVAAVRKLVASGVHTAVWKVEAPRAPAHYPELADVCRTASGSGTRVLLLGGGADLEVVLDDLRAAAAAGLDGFALGRSIWDAPVRRWLRGEASEADTVQDVSDRYARCVRAYRAVTEAAARAVSA